MRINSLASLSAALRYTALPERAFLAHEQPLATSSSAARRHARRARILGAPFSTRPLFALVSLEASGRWPTDPAAIVRMKAAFYLRLAQSLNEKFGETLSCRALPTHLQVLVRPARDPHALHYLFNLVIASKRDAAMASASRDTSGAAGRLGHTPNSASLALELLVSHLPPVCSALHGVQSAHAAFSATVRLAQRWLNAHLLADYVHPVAIELLVAHVFLHPALRAASLHAPASPLAAFLRFLQLLADWDWEREPLVVDLNGELGLADTDADAAAGTSATVRYERLADIHKWFAQNRQFLPPMFIATPFDTRQSVFTSETYAYFRSSELPEARPGFGCPVRISAHTMRAVLTRMRALAADALTALTAALSGGSSASSSSSSAFERIFEPTLDSYDALLRLAPQQSVRLLLADRVRSSLKAAATSSSSASQSSSRALPAPAEFDPILRYVQELRVLLVLVLVRPLLLSIADRFKSRMLQDHLIHCENILVCHSCSECSTTWPCSSLIGTRPK